MKHSSNPPRLMIAGIGSGCGKTTVTCAVLGALKERGLALSSFKSGPDYIDPMFHSEILGAHSRNLDLFLMGQNGVLYSLAKNSQGSRVSIIEGVMGFYDGAGQTMRYSSCDLANETKTPVVLVINAKGMSLTACALLKGLQDFAPNHIRGVIMNHVGSPRMAEIYREMVETHTGLRFYGYLPPMPAVKLESRHLGLVTAAEVGSLKEMIRLLSRQAEQTLDLDGLLELADESDPFTYEELCPNYHHPVRIGVAKDKAFCFYYSDALDLLTEMGAELLPFSPLSDRELPDGVDGLLFGGGYPELYLEELSGNTGMLQSIRSAWRAGMPIYGECGGFQYLQEAFVGEDGVSYPLAGLVKSTSRMTGKLCRFGYVTLTAQKDTLLSAAGGRIPAHEFHYADSDENGDAFLAKKESTGAAYPCMVAQGNLLAGYPHLHFYGAPDFAERFLRACADYRKKRT